VSAHAQHGSSCMYMIIIRMQLSTTQPQAQKHYIQSTHARTMQEL